MTRFPSPLTTAMLLLLLSVAAMAADTGPLSVDTEGGNDVLAPLAAVPIEPEPASSVVVASRNLAPCTDTKTGTFKVEGQNGRKKCNKWKKKGQCDSNLEDGSGKVSSVCEKSCNACAAGCTDTKTGTFKVEGQNGRKKCNKWKKKGQCDSNLEDGSGKVSSVCEKSCNACAAATTAPTGAPSAAPTDTWAPSATFPPSATFKPSISPPKRCSIADSCSSVQFCNFNYETSGDCEECPCVVGLCSSVNYNLGVLDCLDTCFPAFPPIN